MWLLWSRALYYLCFCCLFRPLRPPSGWKKINKKKYRKRQTFPTPWGVVPENHFTDKRAENEEWKWFFNVDFSNRFRLIGVLALSFFPHTQTHIHTHTLPALSLPCILYLKQVILTYTKIFTHPLTPNTNTEKTKTQLQMANRRQAQKRSKRNGSKLNKKRIILNNAVKENRKLKT